MVLKIKLYKNKVIILGVGNGHDYIYFKGHLFWRRLLDITHDKGLVLKVYKGKNSYKSTTKSKTFKEHTEDLNQTSPRRSYRWTIHIKI